jgi:hypothetical protein
MYKNLIGLQPDTLNHVAIAQFDHVEVNRETSDKRSKDMNVITDWM